MDRVTEPKTLEIQVSLEGLALIEEVHQSWVQHCYDEGLPAIDDPMNSVLEAATLWMRLQQRR